MPSAPLDIVFAGSHVWLCAEDGYRLPFLSYLLASCICSPFRLVALKAFSSFLCCSYVRCWKDTSDPVLLYSPLYKIISLSASTHTLSCFFVTFSATCSMSCKNSAFLACSLCPYATSCGACAKTEASAFSMFQTEPCSLKMSSTCSKMPLVTAMLEKSKSAASSIPCNCLLQMTAQSALILSKKVKELSLIHI